MWNSRPRVSSASAQSPIGRTLSVIVLVFLLGLASSTNASEAHQPYTLKVNSLVDGLGGSRGPTLVHIENGRISAVTDVDVTATGEIVDLGDLTLMPGLIDTHVHIGWHFDLDGKTHRSTTFETPAQSLFYAAENAYVTLLAGVTTVQSLGADIDLELRDLINDGTLPGPRVLTSGPALFEGSGNPEELKRKIRALHDRGVDVIKLFASASIRVGGTPTMSQEQLDAACGEAKRLGLRTAVHAHGPESAHRAAMAGCTVLEHGALLDRKTFEVLALKQMYYDPNIDLVLRNYFENAEKFLGIGGYTEEGFAQMREAVPKALESFKTALTVDGLKIVFGTDALAGSHGRNADELVYRVKVGGQRPGDAVISATSTAAESLGLGNHLGRIAPGYIADLIGLAANPLTKIEALQDVLLVIKDGHIIKSE